MIKLRQIVRMYILEDIGQFRHMVEIQKILLVFFQKKEKKNKKK